MVVTIFPYRTSKGAPVTNTYLEVAREMSELARTMPGYISHKTFTAEDGERVTIAEFADEEGQRTWSTNMRHLAAKQQGRAEFYSEYRLQVCSVIRENRFPKA